MTDPTTTPTTAAAEAVAQPTPASGLDIAAIITAFLVAPVGIILGVVSRSQAKQAGRKASTLATVSIVVGSIVTGLTVIGITLPLIFVGAFVNNAATAAERAPKCAQLTTYLPELDAYAARPEMRANASEAEWSDFISTTVRADQIGNEVLQLTIPVTMRDAAEGLISYTGDEVNAIDDGNTGWQEEAVMFADGGFSQAGELSDEINAYCPAG